MTESEKPLTVRRGTEHEETDLSRLVNADANAAGNEREAADTEEANQLRSAIYNALGAYADYLDRCGLIWDLTKMDSGDPLKVESLIAEMDFRSDDERAGPTFNIMLKGGALDPQPHDESIPLYMRR